MVSKNVEACFSITKNGTRLRSLLLATVVSAGTILGGSATAASAVSDTPGSTQLALYQRAVASPVRSDADRLLDASRKPLAFLAFAHLAPGMQVLDVAAGGGTTTRLMALVVGPTGKVYSQGQSVRPAFEKRLLEQPQPNIVPLVQPFDHPLPAGIPPLDLVTINLSYHDIANLPLDRLAMDRALFAALKPGGRLIVIDHAARAGSGAADTRTLHRIDEALVRADMAQAGFRQASSDPYLHNPADTHEGKSSDMEHSSDKFALSFIKPAP